MLPYPVWAGLCALYQSPVQIQMSRLTADVLTQKVFFFVQNMFTNFIFGELLCFTFKVYTWSVSNLQIYT